MTLYALLKTLHVLATVLWVGGMMFAHFFLRPAVAQLEPPQRLRLMHGVMQQRRRVAATADGHRNRGRARAHRSLVSVKRP